MLSFSLWSKTVLFLKKSFCYNYTSYKLLKLGMWYPTTPEPAVHEGEGTGMQLHCQSLNPIPFLQVIVPIRAIIRVCSGYVHSTCWFSSESPKGQNPQPSQWSSALLEWSPLVPSPASTDTGRRGLRWNRERSRARCLESRTVQYREWEKVTSWTCLCNRWICNSSTCNGINNEDSMGFVVTCHFRPPEGREGERMVTRKTLNLPFRGDWKLPSCCFCCVLQSRKRLFLQQFVIRVWYLTF